MFRLSGLLSLALAFGFGAVLFWTSQSVQDSERTLKNKKSMLSQEEEAIRVLATEWDYLNRPQRLEELATEGVGMDAITEGADKAQSVGIVSDVSDIPEPVVPAIPMVKPASLSLIEPAAAEDSLPIHDKDDFEEILRSLEDESSQHDGGQE